MKYGNLSTNLMSQFEEAEKHGKNMIVMKSRQIGITKTTKEFLNMLTSNDKAEANAKMIIEHFKLLLNEVYLRGSFDARQYTRIEQLLNSSDDENKKLGVKLIENASGKTIELVHQEGLDNGTRETTTRTVATGV